MIIELVLVINHLPNNKKNLRKKVYKNFGGKEKGYTFAPAKEEGKASGVERNNTYLDIMLYSTKKDLKN